MDTDNDAKKIIDDAEGALRELISRCMERQEYSRIPAIARLADCVTHLYEALDSPLAIDFLPARGADRGRKNSPLRRFAKPTTSRKHRRETTTREYPRFERDGDKLVKVGWSKKHKSSYEHRAPREVVVAFARHLMNKAPDKRVFAVENLLPVPDPANNGEIPAYQVYLALAWLRDVGAIVKKGKDGYVWSRGVLTTEDFEGLWAEVPLHTG